MFSISIVDVAMGLELLAVIIIIRLFIFVVRCSLAQFQVNKAYKSLNRWQRRYDWALEDGSWLDADNYEWDVDGMEVVLQTRKAAFEKAVNQRTLIRF